jgi:hypothetical protein
MGKGCSSFESNTGGFSGNQPRLILCNSNVLGSLFVLQLLVTLEPSGYRHVELRIPRFTHTHFYYAFYMVLTISVNFNAKQHLQTGLYNGSTL